MDEITKLSKRAIADRMVVLGLRTTAVRRSWMNMRAAQRGLTLQGYFDEVMMREADSPWLDAGERLIPAPIDQADLLTEIGKILKRGGLPAETILYVVKLCRKTEQQHEETIEISQTGGPNSPLDNRLQVEGGKPTKADSKGTGKDNLSQPGTEGRSGDNVTPG